MYNLRFLATEICSFCDFFVSAERGSKAVAQLEGGQMYEREN